jgi:MSHA biogenesis protein MshK
VFKPVLALFLLASPVLAVAQDGLGDPTQPTSLSEPGDAVARAAQRPRWRLQSTLVADDRKVAVINGRTVSLGERIEGATLLEVRSDGVTLQQDGQRLILRLPGRIDVRGGG